MARGIPHGGDRPFGEEDIEFFACVGSSLGAALRRGLGVLPPAGGDAYEPSATGALVLGADLRLVSMTAGARAWVGAFPLAELFAAWGMLPAVIYPLATRVRAGGAVAQAPEPPCGLERNGSDVVRQRLSG